MPIISTCFACNEFIREPSIMRCSTLWHDAATNKRDNTFSSSMIYVSVCQCFIILEATGGHGRGWQRSSWFHFEKAEFNLFSKVLLVQLWDACVNGIWDNRVWLNPCGCSAQEGARAPHRALLCPSPAWRHPTEKQRLNQELHTLFDLLASFFSASISPSPFLARCSSLFSALPSLNPCI